jgi:hypothetical protein
MAKKDKNKSSRPGKTVPFLLLTLLALGGWWLWQNRELTDHLFQYIENGDILTLESKYTPQQLMEARRGELIGSDGKKTYQEVVLKYYPYLLLEVKYTEDHKTREGLLLWGMQDGEIVLDTEKWETSHGFKDCLECRANATDFKILQALAKRQGTATLEDLQKEFQIEQETLRQWIENARRKHLIVQKAHLVQLHFENPKILVSPQTRLKQNLVSRPIADGFRMAKTYMKSQIMDIAGAAFGNDFTIRSEKEVFLPVYSLSVLNPDGSIHITEWNAITGEQIAPKYLAKFK